jgi:transcriptional regulator with XRE-family HTH domain
VSSLRPPQPSPLELPLEELGRRLRAARAYAGCNLLELAAEIPMSPKRLQRIETGRVELRAGEPEAIAEAVERACNLPPRWVARAFAEPVVDVDDLRAELSTLRTRLEEISGVLSHVTHGHHGELELVAGEVDDNGDDDVPPRRQRARRSGPVVAS